MSESVISLKNVTKEYKIFSSPTKRLLYSLTHLKKFAPSYFKATNELSFSIPKGEILGIIGKNGAGKSTVLKLITGVSYPTSGEITVNGRIASLLELGAGFNPELTGMENIFFQGNLLGIKKEVMESRVPEILAFAGIGDFIYQPVKNYSSGMFARLAFATAINVSPDILIVDEVLAVGDIAFQFKCIEKMKEFSEKGVTILFVTHSMMSLYRFCNRCIWIDQGKIKLDGTVEEVVPRYEDFIRSTAQEQEEISIVESDFLKVNHFALKQDGVEVQNIQLNDTFSFYVEYELFNELKEPPFFALSIVKNGLIYDVFGIYPAQERYSLEKTPGKYQIEITFIHPTLNISEYDIYFSILEQNGISQLFFGKALTFNVEGTLDTLGLIDMKHQVEIKKIKDE